jgi:hypothetical protein
MISYYRVADEELLQALEPGGWAHSLVEFRKASGYSLDLQLRGYATRSRETSASLYVGLTKVLDLRHLPGKGFRLRVHPTLGTSKNGWRSTWDREWHAKGWFAEEWPVVEMYLEQVIPTIQKRFLVEGAVQSSVCGFPNDDMIVIDREAAVTYTNNAEKSRIKSKLERPLLAATRLLVQKGWRTSGPSGLGGECDALALARDGTLLAIEIKPRAATSTIRWSPLQARHYANLFSEWVREVGDDKAKDVIEQMVQQRVRIGLLPGRKYSVKIPIRVQPVIVIGRGYSDVALDGLKEVQGCLVEAEINDPPMVVESATLWGRLDTLAV